LRRTFFLEAIVRSLGKAGGEKCDNDCRHESLNVAQYRFHAVCNTNDGWKSDVVW
jgi:hypothetical protein